MSEHSTTTGVLDRRELAHRRTGSLDVALWWDARFDIVEVEVRGAAGDAVCFTVERNRALYAFYHPYAYAAETAAFAAELLRLPAAA
jgi:hypothetical protein